ncbi:hypothetical protein CEUSTIGMA_g13152.t1 [Chlamydomonas eustigma]|uniref:UBX domain-containing protein n=1 Tax=Chlamydomonas eustigma TaxID=1157962 RepID=A0A250XRN2_9CHLO|nr:hypothetical protein CEUSTIGMA_g13152.t1 [Chlamydomonas eustigma]|eukprot:GAX85737.1 hypothetical protein CEUSTIGMA_g13152.t1 [Chlamydomonas eustigma]
MQRSNAEEFRSKVDSLNHMSHIKSFGDLGGGPDSDSDDHDDVNDYYAGGKASGQLIRGAPEEKKGKGDKVSGVFDRARNSGAVDGSTADLEEPSKTFKGSGRTLTGGESSNQATSKTHVITFYRNSVFTVDNGPPRSINDPSNFRFIESISKGECPEELEPDAPGMALNVNLVRKEEDYAEPEKPKYHAFQGSCRTLASSSTTSSSADATASALPPPGGVLAGEWKGVNEDLPVTSLQLRMADGSRMVARFNHSHRVSDIRRFIRASRPDMQAPYHLMTSFPSQVIQDEDKSIEESGLLNAVIIQKNS